MLTANPSHQPMTHHAQNLNTPLHSVLNQEFYAAAQQHLCVVHGNVIHRLHMAGRGYANTYTDHVSE